MVRRVMMREGVTIFVDGFTVDQDDLEMIDVTEVDAIDVFKSLASASIFGLRGGGVSW
jgi:hypothetical protein